MPTCLCHALSLADETAREIRVLGMQAERDACILQNVDEEAGVALARTLAGGKMLQAPYEGTYH